MATTHRKSQPNLIVSIDAPNHNHVFHLVEKAILSRYPITQLHCPLMTVVIQIHFKPARIVRNTATVPEARVKYALLRTTKPI